MNTRPSVFSGETLTLFKSLEVMSNILRPELHATMRTTVTSVTATVVPL